MIETDILECLYAIRDAVSSDKYETLGIWTVGGGNGTYTLKSPVNTEAEWSIFNISVPGSCQILVSNNPAPNALAITGVTYGASGGNENNALEGLFIAYPAAQSGPPSNELYWQPLGRSSALTILISGLASQSAFVTIVWRRLLNRYIPAPARKAPVTHSLRLTDRPQRMLAGQSQMEANALEGRTAIPGGSPYHHTLSPAEQYDQAADSRGIAAPLTPAQIVLAKLRGRTGQDK